MRRIVFCASLLAAAVCCAADPLMRIKLAPELADVESWAINGHRDQGQPLDFGRWQVTSPATYITERTTIGGGDPLDLPNIPVTLNSSTRLHTILTSYRFEIVSEASKILQWSGNCSVRRRTVSHPTQAGIFTIPTHLTQPGYPHLDCKFGGSRGGELSLHSNFTARRDAGFARFAGRTWELRSVSELEKGRFPIPWVRPGFEIVRDGHVVAALDCIYYGEVWMHPSLTPPEEDEIAIVTTALLYYATLLQFR